jgi:glutamine synthetase
MSQAAALEDVAAPPVVAVPEAVGATLAERVANDGVRYLLAMFVDLAGKPCAKLVPVESLEMLQTEGVGFAGFAAGALGQQAHDPDVIAIPDPASYAPLPAVRPGLGLVQCDLYVNGVIWPYAPRVILQAVMARAAARGLTLQAGAELEYFLVQRETDGSIRPADALDVAAQPCYDARSVTRMFDHLSAVSSAMISLGWGNYANDHEDANGQFEQNFVHADALTTADRVITGRYLISMLAEQRGMTATFMPKPFSDRTGTGMHLHLSLWEDEGPLFSDAADPHGLGLSPMAYSFMGGLLDHAPGLQAVLAPTVNSYKRTRARTTASGATWSPNVASFGGNDRTHLIRVPDGSRIELRGSDGSANPYLALAGVLAAGLDGMDRGLHPGAPCAPGTRPPDAVALPPTLLHAVEALEADPVVMAALDSVDPSAGVAQHVADLGRAAFMAWHGEVTPWEHDRYLTAF